MLYIEDTGEMAGSTDEDPFIESLEKLKSMIDIYMYLYSMLDKNKDWQKEQILTHIAKILGIEGKGDFLKQ